MTFRHGVAITLVLVTAACARTEPLADHGREWVGTITTEGNVTTVVNESGSVWGGTATLVEEASIGVEAGADEYMLGDIVAVWADDDHIVVIDYQVQAVRVYDLDGNYLRDLGQHGQGPGEYGEPTMITGDEAGHVFVFDDGARRYVVFDGDGMALDTWPAPDVTCCAYPMVATPDGTLWARTRVRSPDGSRFRYGLREHGPDGPRGEVRWPRELDFVPAQLDIRLGDDTLTTNLMFTPRSLWVIAPSGAIVTGASDRYYFEIQRADGSVLSVEKYWTPVPVAPEEADWHRHNLIGSVRVAGNSGWTWDGKELPTTKPAFRWLIPTRAGSMWVAREGPGEHLPDCNEDPLTDTTIIGSVIPCWRSTVLLDVFDAEGRYLGDVQVPPGLLASPALLRVRGDQVVGVVEDNRGIIRVKRWRLVPPR